MVGQTAVAVAFAGLVLSGRTASAADDAKLTVTVHVEDYARIPTEEWTRVQRLVGEIFSEAGVPLAWAAVPAALVPM